MDTGKQLNANELIAKLQELETENARLRRILDVHGIPFVVTEPNVTTKESQQAVSHIAPKLSLQEKVALFRSVFLQFSAFSSDKSTSPCDAQRHHKGRFHFLSLFPRVDFSQKSNHSYMIS